MRLVILNLVLMLGLAAQAAPALYKIESQLGNNYALAWGIPGQPLDFEELAKDQVKAQEFIDKNQDSFVNYLVDTRSGQIVTNLMEPAFTATLGDEAWIPHNHETWGIERVHARFESLGSGREVTVFMTSGGFKWNDALDSLVAVERVGPVSKVVLFAQGMHDKIESTLVDELSRAERELYEEVKDGANGHSFRYEDKHGAYRFTDYIYEPKSENPGHTLEGLVVLKVDLGLGTVEAVPQGKVTFVKEAPPVVE